MSDAEKPQDEPAVKPQVIDLEAEDVTPEPERAETESAAPPPPPQMPPKRRRRGTVMWVLLAMLAGAAGGGWLYRDLLSAYLPSNRMSQLDARIGALEVNNKSLGEQIAAASQAAQSATSASSALDQALKDLAAGQGETQSKLTAMDERIAAAEQALAAAKSDLDGLRNAVSTAGTGSGGGTADPAALAALAQRIEAVEKDVASLKSAGGRANGSAAAALTAALSDLKAKIAAGEPYAEQYARIARMVPAAEGLEVLASQAGAGLPDAAGLAAELRSSIGQLPQPQAEAPADSGSYWDWIRSALTGIVTIRTIGERDWPALAEKCAGLAQSGELGQAIAAIDEAEGDKPAVLAQWRDRAAARLKLEAAAEQVSQAVLRQIAAEGGTP